jgi:hypothetical protein
MTHSPHKAIQFKFPRTEEATITIEATAAAVAVAVHREVAEAPHKIA